MTNKDFVDEEIKDENIDDLENDDLKEEGNKEIEAIEIKLRLNPEKNLIMELDGVEYERHAIKTHVITEKDDMVEVAKKYVLPHIKDYNDILFISEKALACSQKRTVKFDSVKPGFFAKILAKFVYKSPYGEGLRHPNTMQVAIDEVGLFKILHAAFFAALGKIVGKRGVFYDILGSAVESIDPPAPYNVPPYNEYIVLGPENPGKAAKEISDAIGAKVSVVDVNDINSVILASSSGVDNEKLAKLLKDNPLGQTDYQTPMGIVRKV